MSSIAPTIIRHDAGSVSPAELWWVAIPGKLHRYWRLASAVWSDGIYLTAWPRISLIGPLVALLLGIFEGATHWSPVVLASTRISTEITAVSFMQMVPLLAVAVFVTTLSSNLGLMLVTGFAMGEYLLAGPFLELSRWTPLRGFVLLRLPMLYSYIIFLALAFTPVLAFGLVRVSFRRLPVRGGWVAVRIILAAAIQALLVFVWLLIVPATVRVVWAWAGPPPPIAVSDYRNMLSPWLPAIAAVAMLVRAALVRLARNNPSRSQSLAALLRPLVAAGRDPAWTGRMPNWLRSLMVAVLLSLLLLGFIGSWGRAALVLLSLSGLCLLRDCVLPRVSPWMAWSRAISRVPLVVRILVTAAITYWLTSLLLGMPGWRLRENAIPGDFRVILACIGLGFLTLLALVPDVAETMTASNSNQWATNLISRRTARSAIRALAFAVLFAGSVRAYAVCLDPFCCYAAPSDADLACAAMVVAGALLVVSGGAIAVGAIEAGAAVAAAADAAAAAETAAAIGAADTVPGIAALGEYGAAETVPGMGAIADIGAADTLPGGLQYAPVRGGIGWGIPPEF
jgi:hypothetical protein